MPFVTQANEAVLRHRSRYKWLVVDGERLTLIIMEESKDRHGRLAFRLPEEFHRFYGLAGIEMPDANYREVAGYLQLKWGKHGSLQTADNRCQLENHENRTDKNF